MNDSIAASPLSRCLEMTLREWTERYQQEIATRQVRYRGVLAWKNVLDLWIVQEIIHESQPEVVIEIGCKFGGTTLWLSDTMKTVAQGKVISVDLKAPSILLPENVHFVEGNSIGKQTVATISAMTKGKRSMVIADGNHAADHVLEELRLYGPLVAVGCYFIAEDGIVDVMEWEKFTPGPLRAVQRFLQESTDFEIDRSREKFLLTYAPSGFLKCVRGFSTGS
jgi:cephalosporin hydroxylase